LVMNRTDYFLIVLPTVERPLVARQVYSLPMKMNERERSGENSLTIRFISSSKKLVCRSERY
jgi:hypothetical protein